MNKEIVIKITKISNGYHVFIQHDILEFIQHDILELNTKFYATEKEILELIADDLNNMY